MPEFEKVRQHPRVSLSTLVGVREGSQFHFENSLEISEGGMLLSSTKAYGVGDLLELALKLPYADQVTLIGEVIYVQSAVSGGFRGVGIRFVSISADAQSAIRQYVANVEKQNY